MDGMASKQQQQQVVLQYKTSSTRRQEYREQKVRPRRIETNKASARENIHSEKKIAHTHFLHSSQSTTPHHNSSVPSTQQTPPFTPRVVVPSTHKRFPPCPACVVSDSQFTPKTQTTTTKPFIRHCQNHTNTHTHTLRELKRASERAREREIIIIIITGNQRNCSSSR